MPEKILNESLNTPQEQIRDMGRRVLQAIDEIIEEHGWDWSKQPPGSIPVPDGATIAEYGRVNLLNSPLALGRRFDPKNHGTNYQPEAHWTESVLKNGIIPVLQVPNKLPQPRGMMINLRGAPEFHEWWSEDSGGGREVYKEKTTYVMEEILRKLGFISKNEKITDPRTGKTYHMFISEGEVGKGYYIGDSPEGMDYSWIEGSTQWGINFIEIEHLKLPFVADVIINTRDAEPPPIFVRYTPKEQLTEGVEEQAVRAAEAIFRKSNESEAVQAAKEILDQTKGETTLTAEELIRAIAEIIEKQKRLLKLVSQYPMRDITDKFLPEDQRRLKFKADLGDGSYIYKLDDLIHIGLRDREFRDIDYFLFETPEVGASHPYTRGVDTDNLITISTRDSVDQPLETGTYFIDPRGRLQKFEPRSKEIDLRSETVQPDTVKELDRVTQAFDTLVEKLS